MAPPFAAFLIFLISLLAGCSKPVDSGSPEWQSLALYFEPGSVAPRVQPGAKSGPVRWTAAESKSGRHGGWLTERLAEEDWTDLGHGVWHAQTDWSVEAVDLSELRPRVRRHTPGQKARLLKTMELPEAARFFAKNRADTKQLRAAISAYLGGADPAGFAAATRHDLWLVLDEEDRPGAEISIRLWVDLGRPGPLGWQVLDGAYAGRGLALLAGGVQRMTVDIPPGSALRFSSLTTESKQPGRLQISLDGELLLEQAIPGGSEEQFHLLPLPPAGKDGSELEFLFQAESGRLVLLEPVLGPLSIGTYEDRPWTRKHPDLVLFSLDTFRADNLAHNGGDPRWAPHQNRLAEQSLRFTRARTPASWTLPAHAALFCARMPAQVSMTSRRSHLPTDVGTLASCFTAAGYRVAAITERGYVSRSYGLDQGFGHFEEHNKSDQQTRRGMLAALARDDGRPLLLFVHSYRAHGRYVVSPKARAALGLANNQDQLEERVARLEPGVPGVPASGETAQLLAQFRDSYRGSSYDMDALFGQMLADLEQAGVMENAFLAVTSDHGESFGEHGVRGHGKGTWEEEAHIPLLLHGPGIQPMEREDQVSLIDLPRTLAHLAGIEPNAAWAGVNLMAAPSPRPVATFQCSHGSTTYACVVEGERKLMLKMEQRGSQAGALEFAYDLSQDPGELNNQVQAGDWVTPAEQRLRPLLQFLAQPQTQGQEASIDATHAAELRSMGYAGDD